MVGKPRDITPDSLRTSVVYDPETGIFTRLAGLGRKAGPIIEGHQHNAGYLSITVFKKKYLAHRLAWFWMTGEWPHQVDHRNGVRTDNRWVNLRESDHSRNGMNSKVRTHSKTGIKGVFPQSESKTFCAKITVLGKVKHLGSFTTIAEASAAYQAAAARLHGDFAYHISQETSHG